MADEVTWKEVGGGLLTVLGGMIMFLYRNLVGRINRVSADLEDSKKMRQDLSTRVSVLEQHIVDQHIQVMNAITYVTSMVTDVRERQVEWKEDTTVWRKQLDAELHDINKRLANVEVQYLIRNNGGQ